MNPAEIVRTADLDHVLTRVLAGGGARRASAAQVRVFRQTIVQGDMPWSAWCCRRAGSETALAMLLYLAGETALLLVSEPAGDAALADHARLIDVAWAEAMQRGTYYVQVLAEPQAEPKRKLLERKQFRRLTELVYMERSVRPAARRPTDAPGPVRWLAYGPQTHETFCRVVAATYAESLDCPELLGLRPMDAVIASHKAAGRFEPTLWEIACIDGRCAGCLLTAPLIGLPMLEVVYMGVVPAWRRRGVGTLLLDRSLEHARRIGVPMQTIVVDARNAPARQLYARAGFRPVTRRSAWIRTGPRCGGG